MEQEISIDSATGPQLSMSQRQRAIGLARRALVELEQEIAKHECSAGTVSTPAELATFRKHLGKILEQLKRDQIPPPTQREFGMGHAIADSWPLNSSLGDLLISAEQAYRELK